MLWYYDKELAELNTFTELRDLNLFTDRKMYAVWNKYLNLASKSYRVVGQPVWDRGVNTISVIGVRQNPEISFNLGYEYYNDLLILVHFRSADIDFYVFKCTMDPSRKKYGVAHLLEGVYNSYTASRPHMWMPGRVAIVQDKDVVHVGRTDENGKLLEVKSHVGMLGINIHDAGGYQNSSLGCTVLEPDNIHNEFHYQNVFKPLVKQISNKHSIDYMVINKNTVKALLTYSYKQVLASVDIREYMLSIV